MKPCFIVPTNNILDFSTESNMHLTLAHIALRHSNTYGVYYKELSMLTGLSGRHYIIMDNSTFELGYSLSIQDIIEAAGIVGADEIILPEVFQNKSATIKIVKDSLNQITPLYVIGAVIQGANFHEFVSCFREMLQIPEINVIHIPMLDPQDTPYKHIRSKTQRVMFNRIRLIEIIETDMQRFGKDKQVHLLGLTNPFELEVQRKYDFIRSCDSSSAFIHGYFGHSLGPIGLPVEKISTKMDFENWGVEKGSYQMKMIRNNMSTIKYFCEGGYGNKS